MHKHSLTRRMLLRSGFVYGCGVALGAAGGAFAQELASPKTVHDDVRGALEHAELSMLYDGDTVADCQAWQASFRQQLNELLGNSDPPNRWNATQESRRKFDDHIRYELLLEAPGVPSLPVYLLIPIGLERGQRVPGVLCVHGHGEYGNHTIVGRTDIEGVAKSIDRLNYDYGLQFVRRGYVVAAPCLTPFGRRVDRDKYGGNDPCAVSFVRLQALGKLPITENLRDLRWSLDLLQSRPEVYGDRLGCAGLSYGGRMTMMVTAIDQRIKVASISGALNLMQERMSLRHSCGSQMIPGLLKFGDYSEIGSLIAPRPCVWETGSQDSLIVPKWDDVFRDRLRRAYGSLKAAGQLHFDRFEGGHEWSGRIAYPLFHKVLRS